MPKNIVFCADGTWNGPGEDNADPKDACPTNVFKLFLSLAGADVLDSAAYRSADEQERRFTDGANGALLQVAKYLHGVGDSDNLLVKLLGGVLGAGVIARIVRGYTFISRNYQPGDRIHIVGFSRGAYTARALAGLIGGRGLLDASAQDLSDKATAYRLGAAVWADYRREVCADKDASRLERFEHLLDDLPRFFSQPTQAFKLIADVPIESVAVWDTVGAMGIPEYQADACRLDEFRFANATLGPKVRQAFHAVAIDEQRGDFTPTLWDADPRITQVLFPGAHADVGGGYPTTGGESGLSDRALQWMTGHLASAGVAFQDPSPLTVQPNALAPAHQPWTQLPWRLLGKVARRDSIGQLPTDVSVAQRWGQSVANDAEQPKVLSAYQPPNVPPPH